MRALNTMEIGVVNGGYGVPEPVTIPEQSREEIERFLWEIEQRAMWEEIRKNHGR